MGRPPKAGALIRGFRLPLVAWAALSVWSCGGEPSVAGWTGEVDTLSSGMIHVRNPRVGSWGPGEAWSAVPDLRIGSRESGGPDQFGRVADVAVDSLGRIYVLDAVAREVRVFDGDGVWLRMFGRPGAGPGEMELPTSLEWGPGGRLWVSDPGNGRFQVFDSAGAAEATHPFPPGLYRHGDVWGSDGLFYTFVARRGAGFLLRLVRRRLTDGVLVPMDTLPVPMLDPGETVPATLHRNGRVFSAVIPLPFQATARRHLVPGEGWWLSHPGERYRLARIDFTGDTLVLAERLYEPVRVTDEDAGRALNRLGDGPAIEPDRLPDHHPPVDELARLPDGHLLVRRRVSGDGPGYDVFSPRGIFLGTLVWAGLDRFMIHTATDEALYGVLRDDLDIPYVMRVRLER